MNENERKLLSLSVKYGGLGLAIFSKILDIEHENSKMITESLKDKIIKQKYQFVVDSELNKKKMNIKVKKRERNDKIIHNLKKVLQVG